MKQKMRYHNMEILSGLHLDKPLLINNANYNGGKLKMAKRERIDDVTVKGIKGNQIIFRNFEGQANKFNNAGDRNFCLIIDDELADELESKGFTIKRTKGGDDYDSVPYIKIKVGFTLKSGEDNPHPPRIFKIDSAGYRMLDKNTVKVLDGCRFKNVDLEFRGNSYIDRDTGEPKYSAYLSSFYATLEESDLEREYNERFAGMDSQDPNGLPFDAT